jgi:dephospho-CoA kinase
MRRVIGLTGGIAAGKSTVSAYLAHKKDVKVIDADKISRNLSKPGKPGYQMIVQEFGPSYINEDKTLDRRELGKHVFSSPAELARLEALLHPLIIWQIRQKLDKIAGTVVIDAPLLYKAGLEELCTEVWVVRADDSFRLERVMKRDGVSEQEARDRMANQLPQSELEARGDVVLINNGDPEDLYRQIDEVLHG